MSAVKTDKTTKSSQGLSKSQELNPINPRLTGAFQYMVGVGLITKLTATFEPGGTRVMGVPNQLLASKSPLLSVDSEATALLLLNVAKESGLLRDNKKKDKTPVAPIKPAKNLVPEDFDLSEKDFIARVKAVSVNLGTNIIGRFQNVDKEIVCGQTAGKFFDDLTPIQKASIFIKERNLDKAAAKDNFKAYAEKIFLVDLVRKEVLADEEDEENQGSPEATSRKAKGAGRGR